MSSLATREQGGMATVVVRRGRAGAHLLGRYSDELQRKKNGDFAFSPLDPLKVIATMSSSLLRIKFEHLNIFIKFWKNSCNLPMTCRSSTKIGVAK